ncbi:hypothetical protein Tco_0466634 [Tanacetum coccineum]
MAFARSAAGRTGQLLVGGGFTFSIMKNGIVNGNYEQTHKEEIDYKKADMWKLNSHLKGFKQIEIFHDVVGTSGYYCGVLQSFPVERIEQGNK